MIIRRIYRTHALNFKIVLPLINNAKIKNIDELQRLCFKKNS